MILPNIKYTISDLQCKFLAGDIPQDKSSKNSLISMERNYWNGFYGYYVEQIGKCNEKSEIEIRIEKFKQSLLEYTYSILDNNLPATDYDVLYSTLDKLGAARLTISEILSEISKTFNTAWEEEIIWVFLVPNTCIRAGISSPLLLPAKEDFSIVIQILVHEFIHRNATAKKDKSIYRKIEREATLAGIGLQELDNRIMHPLFFYAAWKLVEESRMFKNTIKEFYLCNEFSNSRFFLNTIAMLKRLWPVNTNLDNDFANNLIESYINNPDRKRYKGVIL